MGVLHPTGCCTVLAILLLRALLFRRLPKRVLVLLWAGAVLVLLAPYSLTSPLSVYGLLPRAETTTILTEAAEAADSTAPGLWPVLRRAGTVTGLIALAAAWLLSQLRLRRARPADEPAIAAWTAAHPLLRPLSVRVGPVTSPLCCGLLRPRILLPEHFDRENPAALDCVLSHEYLHICRFDPQMKLLFALAVCLRWYDPLVWIAALTAGRDMEYACDEAVLDTGIPAKRYAAVLLRAALRRAERLPLTARFNAGQLERRVDRITVHRAGSPLSWLAAGALGLSLLLCLGTVPEASKAVPTELPHSSFLSSVPHSVCKPDAWTWRSALPSREPSSAPSAPDIRYRRPLPAIRR
jgi:beta-lactamase regulating signal transducer with metallopeptidase domain